MTVKDCETDPSYKTPPSSTVPWGQDVKNFTVLRTLLPLILLAPLNAACSPEPAASPVSPELTLTATATEGTAPLRVQFVTEAVGFGAGAAQYAWTIAGSSFAGGPNRSFTFREPGRYEVAVTLTGGGAERRAETAVVVAAPAALQTGNTPPTARLSASVTAGAAPLEVVFRAAATDPDGDPLTYAWDFGNGQTADSGVQQRRTYQSAGRFIASVTVADGRGGVGSAELTLDVAAPPGGGVAEVPPAPPGGPDAPALIVTTSPGGPVPWTVTYRVETRNFAGSPSLVVACEGGAAARAVSGRYVCHHTEPGQGVSVTAVDDAAAQVRARTAAPLEPPANGVPYYGLWSLTYRDPGSGLGVTLPVRISAPGTGGPLSGLDPETGVQIVAEGDRVVVNGLVADEILPSDAGVQAFADDLNLRLEKVSSTP